MGVTESLQREFFLKILRPGDLLLYRTNNPLGRGIQLKTYSKVTHCEIYIGAGRTIASREFHGVDTFDFRPEYLAAILRPVSLVDVPTMLRWHVREAKGQGYDYLGLFLGFFARRWGRENKRMWCSEHTTRAYRRGGLEPFREGVDADSIAPGDLFKSAKFKLRWMSAALRKALGRELESTSGGGEGDPSLRDLLLEESEDSTVPSVAA
jgi:cell wall-associated NlpC family hydrolase